MSGSPPTPAERPTLFARLGGSAAVAAAVEELHRQATDSPEWIGAFQTSTDPRQRKRQAESLGRLFGGPAPRRAATSRTPAEAFALDESRSSLFGAAVAEVFRSRGASHAEVEEILAVLASRTPNVAAGPNSESEMKSSGEKVMNAPTGSAPAAAAYSAGGRLDSLEFLRASLAAVRANIFLADADLNIVFVNDHGMETLSGLAPVIRDAFGVEVSEIVGGSIHRFHRDARKVERILRNPGAMPHEARFEFGGVTLSTRINGVYAEGGATLGYIVVWEDVTERVRADAEQGRLNSMLENSPTNVMLADRDLKIIYVNAASMQLLKKLEPYLPVKAHEVVGSSIDVFHKDAGHQRRLLADDRNLPIRRNIPVGPETADLLVTAIYDRNRNYIGPMVTWELITEKLATDRKLKEATERELQAAEDLQDKVGSILGVVSAAAQGDLTRQVAVQGDDAVGRMGTGLAGFLSQLRGNVSEIGQMSQTLASASHELTAVSQQMASNAEETAAQANVASAAAEQVSTNVATVSAAAEQMGASIREIAKSASEAAKVATSAVKVAQRTNATVAKLGESSAEIGNVVKVITSIAQQTNLLALNATIEAARAGEAGKGFAVVANEVKELAKQTARATEDISRKIEAIQADAKGAVQAIEQIGAIINQINDIQNTIASAVEEQTATTGEIGRNISEAAKGSSEIAHNVIGVAQAARGTTEGASDTKRSADELSKIAVALKHLVEQFKY